MSAVALERWFSPRRFAALAGCVIAACFLPVLFGRETFFFRDFSIFSYPLAAYHRECFWQGAVPLWNPYNNCGIPFLAQWNTMVFYPLSLIYLLFPLPWSLSFFCLFHLFLGGMGMYFLARHWTESSFSGALAGMAFMFNGVLLSCLKWPNNMAALGWMPWVVLTMDLALLRGGARSLAIAALIGATQMLAGAPEVILLTWVFLGVWTCYRFFSIQPRRVGMLVRFGAGVLLVSGLAAVQLTPFLELLRHSQRDATFAASEWPMPIWGWANFLLPLFKMFPSYHGVYAQPGQYWISTYYVSVAVLSLGVSALFTVRRAHIWLLGGLAVLVAWMALGEEGLLYSWARAIPGMGLLRFPIKFVVLAAFILPLLGAYGIHHVMSLPAGSKFPRSLLLLTGAMALAIGGLFFSEAKPTPALGANAAGRVFFLAASGACLLGLWRGGDRKHLAAGALILLVVLDGLTHAPWHNPTVPPWVYIEAAADMEKKPALGLSRAFISPESAYKMDHLKFDVPAEDVMAARIALFQNVNLLENIPKVDGFYALYPGVSWDLHKVLYRTTNPPPAAILDFLGVSQMSAPGSWSRWQTRTNSLPLVTSPERVRKSERPLDELAKSNFDPRTEAIMSSGTDFTASTMTRAEISELRWHPEQISFTTEAAGPSLAVISQTFYKPWKAYINEQAVPILPVNHAFQSIPLPPGKHAVVLKYEDRVYKFGAMVSAIFGLVIGAMIWASPKPRSAERVRGEV